MFGFIFVLIGSYMLLINGLRQLIYAIFNLNISRTGSISLAVAWLQMNSQWDNNTFHCHRKG